MNTSFWRGVSAALGIVVIGLIVQGKIDAQSEKTRFSEIDVERINVVERDGTVKLVIANRERAPDQVSEGQSRPRADNNKSAGITFFDDAGDEAGGLKIRGDRRNGPSARRHLLFDQHRGDQAIGIISDENETGRAAGMTVWDRPDTPLPEVVGKYEAIQRLPEGPERRRAEAAFEGLGATRVFVGKVRQKDAVLALSDAKGRERLRLVVTADGQARIEFKDEQGRTTSTLPARGR